MLSGSDICILYWCKCIHFIQLKNPQTQYQQLNILSKILFLQQPKESSPYIPRYLCRSAVQFLQKRKKIMTYFLEVFRLKFQIYGYCYLPLPLCCCLDDINCIFINTFMARTLILLFYIKISLFTKKLRKTFSTTTSLNMKQNWYHLLPSFLHLQKFKHVISIVEQKTDLE